MWEGGMWFDGIKASCNGRNNLVSSTEKKFHWFYLSGNITTTGKTNIFTVWSHFINVKIIYFSNIVDNFLRVFFPRSNTSSASVSAHTVGYIKILYEADKREFLNLKWTKNQKEEEEEENVQRWKPFILSLKSKWNW